ncbi:SMC-Scp complex subunit ScpB [Loigolactobacillus coryniformis]|jgi:segregation and condensation protein B|uniref:Segregation and condensation protein B n=4 Tax=Loigolactobacillus coryniformis TaxID=1610 RepID=J2ZS05_9LACO|nr:SMC-Scp complex subunit ScpB [Loigolactobacillus coryniformis]MDT3390750.1 SMC-Scp complex subunit ScpB [Bacillota bacterium]RRG07174.1 MAG: SMC-Scp complex subunit ScpB [Lactobacillus sp.]ATO43786.1 SMC-Scp complex subunit ScpB [Loigolactobacillus coryniformis subsp. torquens DSM 20004 = KCTC 3535]ATO55467.1 SMC-Scp complex subunit ScpB [Loigolactobacillus coryniformis subsp. coryniformis KCTC 3167 = DSM 20001]EJN55706.1 Segregation and condensation protein B [Loigolactobacillus coryniform
MNITAELESLLYVVGDDGISLDELDHLLSASRATIKRALSAFAEQLRADNQRGLVLFQFGERYKLVTKKAYAALIKRYFETPLTTNLSQASLETLAIIAYKQPITRVEIDEIRGVQSGGALQRLMLRQLIEERGRKNAPGRPILYGTSAFFMDYFGLKSMAELPPLPMPEADASTTATTNQDLFAQFEAQLKDKEENH